MCEGRSGKRAFSQSANVFCPFQESDLIDYMCFNININYWIEVFVVLYFILISEIVHRRADGKCRLQQSEKTFYIESICVTIRPIVLSSEQAFDEHHLHDNCAHPGNF